MAQPPYCPLTPEVNTYLASDFSGEGLPAWYTLGANAEFVGAQVRAVSGGCYSYINPPNLPLAPTLTVPVVINWTIELGYTGLLSAICYLYLYDASFDSYCGVSLDIGGMYAFDLAGNVPHSFPVSVGAHDIRLMIYSDHWEVYYDGSLISSRVASFANPPFVIEADLDDEATGAYTRLNDVWVVGLGLPSDCSGGPPPASGGGFGRRCGCRGGF